MRSWTLLWMLPLASALAVGCPDPDDDDDDDTVEPVVATADLDMDSDRTGAIEATEDEEAAETVAPGVVLRVDVDDDNASGESDNASVSHGGDDENDLGPGVITFEPPDAVADGDQLLLTLTGNAEAFRLYIDQEPMMGMGGSGPVTEKTLAVTGGESIDIQVEGVDWFATATLGMEYRDAGGEVLSQDEVQLTTTPWLMQHHFDDAHEIWIVEVGFQNAAAVQLFEDEFGEENVHKLSAGQVGYDVWVQDEIQYGYQITPRGPCRWSSTPSAMGRATVA